MADQSELTMLTKSVTVSNLDFSDPLYLHPSDSNSSNLISYELTVCNNYSIWSRAMTIALIGKNKLGFILGTVVYPTDPVLQNQWDRCNTIVLSWILNSVAKDLYVGLVFSTKACDVWNDLNLTYNKIDGSRIFSLHQDISKITQGSDTVVVYYTKLKLLWDEYAALAALPTCTCNASSLFTKHDQKLKLMQFLMGLYDSYLSIRSNILMKDPLPSVMQAFNIVCQEETHHPYSSNYATEKTASAFFGKNSGKPPFKNSNNSNLLCTHCGGKNHTIDRCYQIIGFPDKKPNQKHSNWNKSNQKFSNHVASDNSFSKTSTPVVQNLTPEQCSQLLKLLEDQKKCEDITANMDGMSSNSTSSTYKQFGWIIDSGAINHMVSSLDDMYDIVSVENQNLNIKLPNGSIVHVKFVGKTKLLPEIVLHNVLVIPDFKYKLLSASKLTKDNNCCVSFTKDGCVLREFQNGRNLGTGDENSGLIFFRQNKGNSGSANPISYGNAVASDSTNIWHKRFGHPSNSV